MSWAKIQEYWILQAFGVMAAIIGVGWRIVWKKLSRRIQKTSDESKAIRGGMEALLRDRIIQACRFHMDRGYCSIHDRDNILKMVEQYKALGGNGTISDLHDDLRELPTDRKHAQPRKEEES